MQGRAWAQHTLHSHCRIENIFTLDRAAALDPGPGDMQPLVAHLPAPGRSGGRVQDPLGPCCQEVPGLQDGRKEDWQTCYIMICHAVSNQICAPQQRINHRACTMQGEVEQISMMKPIAQTPHETSLLEYLEDIIGTHTYVAPIEEAAKKYGPDV